MNLRKFDNKRMRIKDIDDSVYEGLAEHSSIDYNYHEYGVEEESIEFGCFRFYKSTIKEAKEIKEYTDKYGLLEEEIFKEKMDLIDEQLEFEDENSIRLVRYLIDHKEQITFKEELNTFLNGFLKYNENKELEELIKELLKEEE